jgi:hypothetical protein
MALRMAARETVPGLYEGFTTRAFLGALRATASAPESTADALPFFALFPAPFVFDIRPPMFRIPTAN